MSNGRGVGRVRSLPVNRSWPQSAYMPHTILVQSSVYYCGSNSWNVPSLKLSANFCRVFLVISRYYSAGTRVTSIVAYSDFTSKSPDYALSKPGLFSTKLSQTIIAWTLLFYKTDTKSACFSSFSRNHKMVSAHARRGRRLHAIVWLQR